MSKSKRSTSSKLAAAKIDETDVLKTLPFTAEELKNSHGQLRSTKSATHYQLVFSPTISPPPAAVVGTDSMAESNSFRPPDFKGNHETDAKSWMLEFDKYADFCGYDAAKTLKMLKLFLKGPAAQWLEGLPADKKETLAKLKAEFKQRYETSELINYQLASDLFNKRQQVGESVDCYITAMSDIARAISWRR